ncbi:MAG: sigma 54-interacting transcriptional regulator [Thermoanaerobaculaceae bacterium]
MSGSGLHPLALWDAPFLPGPETPAASFPLAEGYALPLLQRKQLASQLLAALSFCLHQGFYPARRLWQTARFAKTSAGVALQLSHWPNPSLEDPTLSYRLARGRRGELVPWLSLKPILARLLPEFRETWEEVPDKIDPWSWPALALARVLLRDRERKALAHPEGWGRFLWSRHFLPPKECGLLFCPEPSVVARLVQAGVVVASFNEGELGSLQGSSLARDEGKPEITTLPLSGVKTLPLSVPGSFWCLLPEAYQGETAEPLAGVSPEDPRAMGLALAQVVRNAWWPEGPKVRGPEGLLSPTAAKLLAVLRGSILGLTRDEAITVSGEEALEELQRFSLVIQRFGRYWPDQLGKANPKLWRELLPKLPDGPLVWAWRASLGEGSSHLLRWCEEQLEVGEAEPVLALAPLAEHLKELAAPVVEAALTTGWLPHAQNLVDELSGPRGELLKAWWAAEVGEMQELEAALEGFRVEEVISLPQRLQSRWWLIRARQAERVGRWEQARECAAKALANAGTSLAVAVESLYFLDHERLKTLARDSQYPKEVRQRAWHLLGIAAFSRGDYAKAQQFLKHALQSGSGRNPLRLGELFADAGTTAMLLDRPLAAERLFAAAEAWLSLAGCERVLRSVRFNRAVLANDRLRWQKAQEILASLGDGGGRLQGHVFAAVEWARSWLAQGHLPQATRSAKALEEALASLPLPEHLRQGVAAVLSHVALLTATSARSLAEVERWLGQAEPSERRLLAALLASREGRMPPQDLPPRWGMAFSARLLAQAKIRPEELPRLVNAALAKGEPEAALGLARALLLAPVWGVDLLSKVRDFLPKLRGMLRELGLVGWLSLLERQLGRDWVQVFQGLEALLADPAAFWQAASWRYLMEATNLTGLRVCYQGKELLRVGEAAGSWRGKLSGFDVELEEVADEGLLAVLTFALGRAPLPIQQASGSKHGITGKSEKVRALCQAIDRLAPLPVTVLIQGEPGTGKERVAKAIHRASGRTGQFVAINCAGMPEALLEAELFGVVRGAFTGADRDRPGLVEEAEGGTLFLDEVGELPLAVQAKLLRLLQQKEVRRVGGARTRQVDVRFVAATNRNLWQAVEAGTFRRDLYDRLATVTLEVPALRERLEDLPEIVNEILITFSSQLGLKQVTVAPEVLFRLSQHTWPGNIRELESVLLQATIRCQAEGRLGVHHLPWKAETSVPLVPFEQAKEVFLREYLTQVLRACGGNRTDAAKLAGLSRQALHYYLRKLRIEAG